MAKASRSQAHIFKRYIWLMSALYDYKRLSFEEISHMWERSSLNDDGKKLPKRTFHDHIEAISDIFGINIRNEGTGSYKYFIENTHHLNKDELRTWMLVNFSLSYALSDINGIEHRIFIDDIPSSKRWLSTIVRAIKEKRVLSVEYTSYQKGKVPTIMLCPYFVKLYENRWYVYGRRTDEAQMKHYALDRIDEMTETDETFAYEPSLKEREMLELGFGHSLNEQKSPQEIRIKATKFAAQYLDSLPLHKSQEKVEEGKDYVVYKYFFIPSNEFDFTIKKWGGQLQVLE